MVKLRTLGECVAETALTRLGPDAERLFAVLLCLGIERNRLTHRMALTNLLWPDVSEGRGSHSLRQAVYRLRSLGVEVQSDRSHVWISPEALDVDCAPLLEPSPEPEGFVNRIRGSFLTGYQPRFSDSYSEWLDRQRDLVNARIRRVFLAEITRLKGRGDWSGVECMAARCLAIDPLNEEATLAKAESAALQGGKTQALAILDGYLKEVGPQAREIRLPATVLRRRIAEATNLDRPRAITETPFFGRAKEMAELNRALQLAHAGSGSACLFWGEPGIGKTRLMQEFGRALSLGHAQVVRAGCQSNDDRRPLSMFVDMLPRLMAMPGALGCSPAAMRFLRRLTDHDPKEPLASMDTRDAAMVYANIRKSMLDLLDAVASEALLVIVIEDVHWLDVGSWDVIADALSWVGTRRVLLLLTSREPDSERARGLRELPGLQRMHLAPLDRPAVDALSATIVERSGQSLPADVAEWCADSCGGNPYHLTELVLHGLREGRTAKLPASLAQLIAERLGRLQPLSLHVLQGISVLGVQSTLDRLERLLDQRRVDLLDALDELERSGLIESDNTRLLSKHDLLSQTAVQRLSVAARRLLHRHAASVLERDAGEAPAPAVQWACAEHWREAGEVERALRYLQECARYALEAGAADDASDLLDHAMSLTRSTEEIEEILATRMRVSFFRGRWDVVAPIAHSICRGRIARDPDYDGHDDEELLRIESLWRSGGQVADQLRLLLDCVTCSSALPSHGVKAAALGLILCDNERDPVSAKKIYDAVAPLLTFPHTEGLEHQVTQIVYHASFGDLSDAAAGAIKLANWGRRSGVVQSRLRANQIASYALRSAGMLNEAYALSLESYSTATHHRVEASAATAALRLAGVCYLQDKLPETAEWLARAEKHARDLRDFGAADALLWRMRLALRSGNAETALQVLERFSTNTIANQSTRCRAERWAITTRIHISCNAYIPNDIEIRQAAIFANAHLNACSADFVIASVCQAYYALGAFSEAKTLLANFLRSRRDRYPISWELRILLENATNALAGSMPHSSDS